ncbi:MAG: hypothetical protein IJF76_00875 [Clostridia bacterium]|nr:hypothetical protein [Clostridia bacterium]
MLDCAVIDIGSNSVRLMRVKGGVSEKFLRLTQLGKGLTDRKTLDDNAINSTIQAIKEFILLSQDLPVYAFATEAVRRAQNGGDFIKKVCDETGVKIDLLTPEEEAKAGFLGASSNKECSIIDIGGASTEFCYGVGGNIVRAVSTPIGAVKLKDLCGDNRFDVRGYLDSLFEDFAFEGEIIGIGGTITALGAMCAGLKSYNKEVVHGYRLGVEQIRKIILKLENSSLSEIMKEFPVLPEKRACVIDAGAKLLLYLMERYGLDKITLSDTDNTEGYLILRNL